MKALYNIMYKGIATATLGAALLTVGSCKDYLDEMPDNRTEIDTPDKVKLLLTSAYPNSSAALLCELSGDNLVDNNVEVNATHRAPYYDFHEEAYAWEDIRNYNTSTPDTPYDVWEAYYYGIAACNHALEAMDKMEAEDPTLKAKLDPYRGEALVLRAYLHFTLVNVFSMTYRDSTLSLADRGVPYADEPETTVAVDYSADCPSVTEVYRRIEEDLTAGIDLIDNSVYSVRAYHMNKNAANAFAARFYLYKRDYKNVIKHADKVLGTDPAAMMRKWGSKDDSSSENLTRWWCSEKEDCNLLLQTTYSLLARTFSSCRFSVNGTPKDVLFTGSGPCWTGWVPVYEGCLYYWVKQDYGSFLARIIEFFEYTDKIAGIGYVHTVYIPFTAEETLLCRAEARLYDGDEAGAISDLNTWAESKQADYTLTRTRINNFYKASKTGYVQTLHNEDIAPDFIIPDGAKPVVDCILHFRRIETIYEGLRWFDIKRYGIEIAHEWKGPKEDTSHRDTLRWDDPRRALQIPNDVIAAGFEATDRALPEQTSSGYSVPAYSLQK